MGFSVLSRNRGSMKSPEIVLSLNEIMFYFTRAGVGAGLSFGLAEDFGRSSIWLAVSGLDPARITSKTPVSYTHLTLPTKRIV